MISVSIGICAYNEEKNIGRLLEALLNQRTEKIKIKEIIVVSSGSTDRTDEIVREFSDKDKRIRLITQPRREGKASAVNEFIKNASGDVCVLESADTIPLKDTIEKLCLPFYDEKVGMTGGRPIPVNDRSTFMGFVGHLLWDLHHKIALENPKLGELVAFRNVIDGIPKNTAVDEAWIEAIIRKKGYKVVYVPEAICYNKAPETISDYLRQRRRIYAGHLHLKHSLDYSVSTMNAFKILKLILNDLNPNPKDILYTFGAMTLEFVGRVLGWYDYYIKKKDHVVWEVATTTKNLR
jgi:cellulose synthase/poly-beta-1,6-N-acetylglucosamine synthase-like glycosyltransferase